MARKFKLLLPQNSLYSSEPRSTRKHDKNKDKAHIKIMFKSIHNKYILELCPNNQKSSISFFKSKNAYTFYLQGKIWKKIDYYPSGATITSTPTYTNYYGLGGSSTISGTTSSTSGTAYGPLYTWTWGR